MLLTPLLSCPDVACSCPPLVIHMQVFDNKESFALWFDTSSSTGAGAGADDGLEGEQRVVVIHRLHQILEPFMLRRQVEDVESKLPPKACPGSQPCNRQPCTQHFAWPMHDSTISCCCRQALPGNAWNGLAGCAGMRKCLHDTQRS